MNVIGILVGLAMFLGGLYLIFRRGRAETPRQPEGRDDFLSSLVHLLDGCGVLLAGVMALVGFALMVTSVTR